MNEDGFERTKTRTRERLQAAVRELIPKNGIDALTVKTIARQAGVSPVSIYNHFGGVNELILDVARSLVQGIWEQYQAVICGPGTFMQKLDALLQLRIGYIRDGSWRILQGVGERYGGIWKNAENGFRQRLHESLRTLLKQGYGEGAVDKKIEEDTLLMYIYSFSEWFSGNEAVAVNERRARELTRLFLFGLRGPSE